MKQPDFERSNTKIKVNEPLEKGKENLIRNIETETGVTGTEKSKDASLQKRGRQARRSDVQIRPGGSSNFL